MNCFSNTTDPNSLVNITFSAHHDLRHRKVSTLKYLLMALRNKVLYPDSALKMKIGSSPEDHVLT